MNCLRFFEAVDHMDVFLSIIIPVYNAAIYLPKSLSVLQAELPPGSEVILVNDGSTDDSLAICQRFINGGKDFFVFSQANAGPSAARNHGLKEARGRYITFLDADDEFSPGTLLSACDYLRKCDTQILFQQVERCTFNGNRHFEVKYDALQELNGTELFNLWCRNSPSVRGFFGGKIYSRHLLDGVVFPEDMRFAEDMYALSDILVKTQKAVLFPTGSYLYYQRPDTPTTGAWTVKKSRWLLKAYIHRWECSVIENFPIDDQTHAWSHALALFVAERRSFPDENWTDIRKQLKARACSLSQVQQSSLSFKRKLGLLRNILIL